MWERDNHTYSYEILWRAAHSALAMADIEDARIRRDHLSICSVLTAFLAFEGFVNFVGDEIAPEIWKVERTFFSGPEYKGITGKVDYLFSLFKNGKPKKSEEPYRTFARMKRTRDDLAHNRVLRYEERTEDASPSLRTSWSAFDTPEKIFPALERLKDLAELIRVNAVVLLNEDYAVSHLHYKAFEGPLATSAGVRKTRR